MGLKPQPSPNSITNDRCLELRPGRQAQILERACKFNQVMVRHLRTSKLRQQGSGFAALMQGDLALH